MYLVGVVPRLNAAATQRTIQVVDWSPTGFSSAPDGRMPFVTKPLEVIRRVHHLCSARGFRE